MMHPWQRTAATLLAGGFVLVGIVGIALGVLGYFAWKDVEKQKAAGHREEVFDRAALCTVAMIAGVAAVPHVVLGGLFFASKRFPSLLLASLCFADSLFWAYGIVRGVRSGAGLVLFGALTFAFIAAGIVFLHPAVRRRATVGP